VATLESIRAPALQSPLRSSHERLAGITVLGDHRLRLTLREPHAPYLSDLSVGILPARSLGPDGQIVGPPIGAGPYALHARTDDREVVLARHDRYWRGRPKLPWLVFRAVADQNTRLLALLGGAADLVQNAVTPRLADAMRTRPGLVVDTAPGVAYTYLCPNLRVPTLSDVRVRRALLMALDRDGLIEHKFRGVARKSDSMLPAGHWAFNDQLPPVPVDLAGAAALLDAAGFPPGPDGVRLTVELKVNTDKFRRNLAWLIAADWARIGVATKVRPLEPGTLLADVKSGNFELYLLQWGDPSEPHLYNWIFHSDRIPTAADPNRGGNRSAWRSPAVDRLIEAGGRAPAAERAALYREVQRLVAEDLPYLSLWHEDVVVVRREGRVGYVPSPDASLSGLWQAHWAPGQPPA
jgi:peptide/nickel transport system substrate-binding protein